MRVIIIGAGQVGYQVAKYLSLEDVEIVLIDKDGEKLKRIVEELDVAVIEAEGGDPEALKEASAEKADILLAVTNSDETNMIACLLAKAMFNIPRKIARIRNPGYFFNKVLLSKEHLDIDPAINPEMESALAIWRLLKVPFASEVLEFEEGKVLVIVYKVPGGSSLAGKKLKDLGKGFAINFLVGLIVRDERVIIPRGEDVIKEGDLIYVPVKMEEVPQIADFLGESKKPIKRVMIMGGGRIGYYLAKLAEKDMEIKIVEEKKERCEFLSNHLNKALILCGDGTDRELLSQENIKEMDVFVATSNKDELNIMSCLLAKKMGVRRVIAIINKSEYISLAHNLGIECVINPRLLTASIILRYIRAGEVLSLSAVGEHKAEVMEVKVSPSSGLAGKKLSEVKFPKNTIVGVVLRGEEVIIPRGDTQIEPGDRIIFFAKKESIKSLENLFN